MYELYCSKHGYLWAKNYFLTHCPVCGTQYKPWQIRYIKKGE